MLTIASVDFNLVIRQTLISSEYWNKDNNGHFIPRSRRRAQTLHFVYPNRPWHRAVPKVRFEPNVTDAALLTSVRYALCDMHYFLNICLRDKP